MIEIPYQTTTNIDTTVLTNDALATGATVTITIDLEGVTVVDAASMSHQGSGVYRYVLAGDTLTERGGLYDVTITAVDSGNDSVKRLKAQVVDQ